MKVTYDAETDTLRVLLKETPIAESDEEKAGVIIDFDANGDLVGFEIMDASKRVNEPRRIDFVTVG
ncbi:MAG: hypothetical protein AMXMBFR80_09360 [Dehalococcoidia bacterium]